MRREIVAVVLVVLLVSFSGCARTTPGDADFRGSVDKEDLRYTTTNTNKSMFHGHRIEGWRYDGGGTYWCYRGDLYVNTTLPKSADTLLITVNGRTTTRNITANRTITTDLFLKNVCFLPGAKEWMLDATFEVLNNNTTIGRYEFHVQGESE